ncbi:MAG TPA: citrate lyase subunit alpha [Candidatus Limnocylindria bacterium]|nr:citrate lyase subunit alpha [Candidatus Limnocylindria bacterium]
MKNIVGREIPKEILDMGYRPYQGQDSYNGKEFQKVGPKVRVAGRGSEAKVLPSLREAIAQCGLRDGMTVSFHHHFRDGDYVMEMVMREIAEMGFRDIRLACSSIGSAAQNVADYIEQGIVTGLTTSGIRDRIGEAVSYGKLKNVAVLRSHGGRVRAIESGEIHIDVAFIGAPTCDEYGNASGKGGKSDCGSLSYAEVDALHADRVVVITDTLVPFPNKPSHIDGVNVDFVVVVDAIGNPKKIASAAARITTNPRDLAIAESCVEVMRALPYFKDGFSFQTGVGGPSIATTIFLRRHLHEMGIRMGWIVGGISTPMVELLKDNLVGYIADVQDFDLGAVQSLGTDPRHFDISVSEYSNAFNKGAFVNKLDFVILSALEADVDFNVNVLTGSDGVLRGAPGGHPDPAAASKCCIIVTPLVRGRIPTICDRVVTVTTAGESVDVIVTDYGVAVNPNRPDLKEALDRAGIAVTDIHKLRDTAYSIVGTPDDIRFEDRVVAVVEARDGTVMDVVRQVKPFNIDEA